MARQPRSKWSPDQLTVALMKEQNKFIHLDPVPNFNQRNDIKPWLQNIFFPQGIDLVIERSDSAKVIFKCKSPNTKTRRSTNSNDNNNGNDLSENKKFSCPFRIRATYSIRLHKWKILVINNVHTHDLEFNPQSDEYKKFKRYLLNENDLATLKDFEEMEYKSKLKLPLVPEIISCDCGMTSEIKLGNLILPQPQIAKCTLKSNRINKKMNLKPLNSIKNNEGIKNEIISKMDNQELDSLYDTKLDDMNTYELGITNKDDITTLSGENEMENKWDNANNDVINLDEIDFTDMFMTQPIANNNKNSNSNNSSVTANNVDKNNFSSTNTLVDNSQIDNIFSDYTNGLMPIATPYGDAYNDNITMIFNENEKIDLNRDTSLKSFDDLLSNPHTEVTTMDSFSTFDAKFWLSQNFIQLGELCSDTNQNNRDFFTGNNHTKPIIKKIEAMINPTPNSHPTPPLDSNVEREYIDPTFLDLIEDFNM